MSNENRSLGAYNWGGGMALGTGIGIALGVAMDNIGGGVAIGAGIGAAFAIALAEEDKEDEPAE